MGNTTKSFVLPYKFANLVIELDTGSGFVTQNVGIDNIDNFVTDDVLYNFEAKMIRFETNLANTNKIRFSGNPKTRVFAIARDSISIAKYGIKDKLIREDDIASNTIARQRATAELLANSETAVDAKFKTREPGLRVGMYLQVQSDNLDADDQMVIKTLTFKPLDPFAFGYEAECITSKRFDFIDLLQRLLRPSSLSTDEAEVAENIEAFDEVLLLADLWEQVDPDMIEEDLILTDVWYKDAVAPGSIVWVWGFYAPTDVTDTKRMGRWDRDTKWA